MNGVFNYNAAYMRFAHTSCIVSVNREMLYFARSQFKVPIYTLITQRYTDNNHYNYLCVNFVTGRQFYESGIVNR